jgi:phytoene/squalene synthetase
MVPPDRYALYGREQAITVAIGREFARPYNSGPEAQADIAVNYAKNKFAADIVDITPDPLGHRLTVTFKSGWRVAILPIDDGKTGDETRIPS